MKMEQLNQFHRDLSCLLLAGVPLELKETGRPGSLQAKLQQLEDHRKIVQARLPKIEGLTVSDGLSPIYLAALQVFATTGKMDLVLDALTLRNASTQAIQRMLRKPMAYMFFVLILAYLGIFFFHQILIPEISEFRDQTRQGQVLPVGALDYSVASHRGKWLAFGMGIIFLVAAITQLFKRLVFWWAGNRFLQSCEMAVTTKVTQVLVTSQVAPLEALKTACQLTGVNFDQHTENWGAEKNWSSPQHWKFMHHSWLKDTALQLTRLKVIITTISIGLVGALLVLGYSLFIYGALVTIYDELFKVLG